MTTHLTPEQIANIQKCIFEFLAENCCGYNQAKPRQQILEYLTIKGYQVSDREMRRLVDKMVDGNYLIGTGESGYYLIDTPSDLAKAMHSLEMKAASIAIRKNELQRNFNSHFQELADKQLELIRESI
jgi:hypothetical protein